MRKKLFVFVLFSLTLLMSFSGCSSEKKSSSKKEDTNSKEKLTVENIIDDAKDAIKSVNSYTSTLNANADGSYVIDGFEVAFKSNLNFEEESIVNGFAMHSNGDINVSKVCDELEVNENSTYKIEAYFNEKELTSSDSLYLDAYFCMDNMWVQDSFAEEEKIDVIGSYLSLFEAIEDQSDNCEVKEADEKVNGKDVNIISGSINIVGIEENIRDVLETNGMCLSIPTSDENQCADIEIWFYDDSNLPAKIIVSLPDNLAEYELEDNNGYEKVTVNEYMFVKQINEYDCINQLDGLDEVINGNADFDTFGIDYLPLDFMIRDGTLTHEGVAVKLENIPGYTDYAVSLNSGEYDGEYSRLTANLYSTEYGEFVTDIVQNEDLKNSVSYTCDNVSWDTDKTVQFDDFTAYYSVMRGENFGDPILILKIDIEMGKSNVSGQVVLSMVCEFADANYADFDDTKITEIVNNLCGSIKVIKKVE